MNYYARNYSEIMSQIYTDEALGILIAKPRKSKRHCWTRSTFRRSSTCCRPGRTWSVPTYLLGLKDVRNYDGSWTKYG